MIIDTIVLSHCKNGAAVSERGKKTVERIVKTGADIFMDEGFSEVTMRRVSRDADMKLQNVQHYFSSREDLMCAVTRYFYWEQSAPIFELHGRYADNPETRLEKILDRFLEEAGQGDWALWIAEGIVASNQSERHRETALELYEGLLNFVSDLLSSARPELSGNRARILTLQITALIQGVLPLVEAWKHSRPEEVRKIVKETRKSVMQWISG